MARHKNNLKNKNPDASALAKHSFENTYLFDFQTAQVMGSESDLPQTFEMYLIFIITI